MKFLCVACDEAMTFEEVEDFEDGSLSVTFRCPRCRQSMAMLTNPHETQLVRSLGVSFGGGEEAHEPMKLVRSALKNCGIETLQGKKMEEEPRWMEEAEVRLQQVPGFIRPMVKKRVEAFARERRYNEITVSVMDEAKAHFGM